MGYKKRWTGIRCLVGVAEPQHQCPGARTNVPDWAPPCPPPCPLLVCTPLISPSKAPGPALRAGGGAKARAIVRARYRHCCPCHCSVPGAGTHQRPIQALPPRSRAGARYQLPGTGTDALCSCRCPVPTHVPLPVVGGPALGSAAGAGSWRRWVRASWEKPPESEAGREAAPLEQRGAAAPEGTREEAEPREEPPAAPQKQQEAAPGKARLRFQVRSGAWGGGRAARRSR